MTAGPEANVLLGSLPPFERQILRQHLRPVSLQTKQQLYETGATVRVLLFPVNAAISIMDMQRSGQLVEVAVIGREGCTSSHSLEGLRHSPTHTLVEIGGDAFQVDLAAIEAEQTQLPVLHRMARRFSAVMYRHAVISVGCSQWHSVPQRLARWLLAHHHRTDHTVFPFTHEFLAEQLGCQRATITEWLGDFQQKGLVKHGYGSVELLDVPQLRTMTCECFGLAAQAIDEYLKDIESYRS